MTDIASITVPISMAFALAAGEGETFWWESQLFTMKCSEGGLGLVDCTLEAGSEPPMLTAGGFVPVPELMSTLWRQIEAIQQALAPWAAAYMYLNYSDTKRDPASFWEAQAYQRLRRVKSAVDPEDLIRSNHPIPPAE